MEPISKPYGAHKDPNQTVWIPYRTHMKPIQDPCGAPIGPIWDPYGAHIEPFLNQYRIHMRPAWSTYRCHLLRQQTELYTAVVTVGCIRQKCGKSKWISELTMCQDPSPTHLSGAHSRSPRACEISRCLTPFASFMQFSILSQDAD